MVLNDKGLYVQDTASEHRILKQQLDKSVTALTAVLDKVASAPAASAAPPTTAPAVPPTTAPAVSTPVHVALDPATYRAEVRESILHFLRPGE